MRKVSSLIALALLAVSGTSFALTCTYDNVPAATLLVPYFRVSNNGVTNANQPIPTKTGETDTLMAITNVSANGLIVHATVWNKYSAAVLDYNIPLTAYDVVYFSAKQILNGQLNANLKTITFWRGQGKISKTADPCSIIGSGQFNFVRFANPDSADAGRSISIYADPAYTGAFREKVWDSLDESGDINEWQDPSNSFILDADNPACGDNSDGVISGDFSGYITFDVANYCTNHFPDEATYYTNDAIATRGWPTNALIGDVFYIDYKDSGNISGDQMIPLEFDAGLDWLTVKTFYSRYNNLTPDFPPGTNSNVPDQYEFRGDGREALGERYRFRFFNAAKGDGTPDINTWILVWRSDRFDDESNNLCGWYYGDALGFEASPVGITVYDDDENSFVPGGGPSGGPAGKDIYIFLEAQRIDLFNSASQWNVGGYKLGWIDLNLGGQNRSEYNQGWVGVQHSGAAAFLSVGHGAAQLTQASNCTDLID